MWTNIYVGRISNFMNLSCVVAEISIFLEVGGSCDFDVRAICVWIFTMFNFKYLSHLSSESLETWYTSAVLLTLLGTTTKAAAYCIDYVLFHVKNAFSACHDGVREHFWLSVWAPSNGAIKSKLISHILYEGVLEQS